jgi:galactokinase
MNDDIEGPLEQTVAFAPGRVNLIGDHTDYSGGYAMPMAIQLGTEVSFLPSRSASRIELSSSIEDEPARVPLAGPTDPVEIAMLLPAWSRHVAGVVAAIRPRHGGKGIITSDLPVGAGLSSSASLAVATALALGWEGDRRLLAEACQYAEHLATGVRTGLLDQLAITLAEPGTAMFLDCTTLEVCHVPLPEDLQIVVVDTGIRRATASDTYARRVTECELAAAEIGPLRDCTPVDVDRVRDRLLRRRARHVVSENARVRAFAAMLGHGDLRGAGRVMDESHRSLATDFEVSIPELDQLVSWLQGLDGVYGARLTGAGLGGCAVVACRPGALTGKLTGRPHWTVRPSAAAGLRHR